MKRLFFRLCVMVLMATVLTAGGLAWFAQTPVGLRQSPLDFTVEPGSSMRQVARQLVDAGIDVEPFLLVTLSRLTRQANAIKAGSYQIEKGVTSLQLLDKLSRGDTTQRDVALIEGWSFRQFRAALDRHPDLRHDSAGLSDAQVLERIGAAARHPEGLFFPDTYLFARQSSDLDVLRRAYRNQQRVLQREWEKRAGGLPYKDPYEALIMASIVEKETGLAADRPLVASVFVNRLRAGMLLQTDPTVIYGLGTAFDGNLRKRDLLADSAYNTYLRMGLPPTPISMPGVAAMRAALNPQATDYLYFVARGDGSSAFSRSLDEHNRAVARYIRKPSP
ncbi:endolytic transglycosylase MltG [Zoogloea dura]|uniref:Endolytic murein transglycosylase n=1 Tax=Zoogloea dura TaxID=2728840 RepID=A0A848FZ59_9RHOO|nr:endolytic transglycosylase MltG [Zoogloea dura]NML24364.1 endolytic transglycosylase MltG [Zoogloea dura]